MLYMVTWIPSIYTLYVSINTSTMDPSWDMCQSEIVDPYGDDAHQSINIDFYLICFRIAMAWDDHRLYRHPAHPFVLTRGHGWGFISP